MSTLSFRGVRVELSPSTVLWMRGARFGTISKIVGQIAVVRMDHPGVKRLQKIPINLLSSRTSRIIGGQAPNWLLSDTHVYFITTTGERMCVTDIPGSKEYWVDPEALEVQS